MSRHWTLDDIAWNDFDAAKVDADILRAVKAAALVEYNAPDYVTYLCNVFADKPEIKDVIQQWGREEVQHGQALARWATLADPQFDFEQAMARFRKSYSIPTDAIESVRGSRAGEMIARCVVESGTSSYYTAIKEASREPVLKQIASNIAADEFRHYKLFYDCFNELDEEKPSVLARLRVAVGRISEADDDELACAYFCANTPDDGSAAYDRVTYAKAYEKRALGLYRRQHVERLIAMVGKASGLKPQGIFMRSVSALAWRYWQFRNWRLASAPV